MYGHSKPYIAVKLKYFCPNVML